MQHGDLGIAGIARAGRLRRRDQRGRLLEDRRQRQLVRAGQADRVVEQLADQELHAIRPPRRPAREAAGELVEDRRPVRGPGGRRQPRQLVDQLGRDVLEDRGVELLLAREVIDRGRVRDPGGRRDVARARAVEPRPREQLLRRGEDAVAGALALRGVAPVGHRKPYDRTRKAVRMYEKATRSKPAGFLR